MNNGKTRTNVLVIDIAERAEPFQPVEIVQNNVQVYKGTYLKIPSYLLNEPVTKIKAKTAYFSSTFDDIIQLTI